MSRHQSEPSFNQPLVPPVESLTRADGLTPKAAGELLETARRDPAAYWAQIAREPEWQAPWIHTLDGGFPRFRYFSGGVSNVSVTGSRRPCRAPEAVRSCADYCANYSIRGKSKAISPHSRTRMRSIP